MLRIREEYLDTSLCISRVSMAFHDTPCPESGIVATERLTVVFAQEQPI